jgi:hypothetical protein
VEGAGGDGMFLPQCYAVIIPALDAFSGFAHVRAWALGFGGLFFTVCCRSRKELVCMQRAGGEKRR